MNTFKQQTFLRSWTRDSLITVQSHLSLGYDADGEAGGSLGFEYFYGVIWGAGGVT